MKNICLEIQCPWAYKRSIEQNPGCGRYSVAGQCHLARNNELSSHKKSTEYYLYDDSLTEERIQALKTQNDEFLSSDKEREELAIVEACLGTAKYEPFTNRLVSI